MCGLVRTSETSQPSSSSSSSSSSSFSSHLGYLLMRILEHKAVQAPIPPSVSQTKSIFRAPNVHSVQKKSCAKVERQSRARTSYTHDVRKNITECFPYGAHYWLQASTPADHDVAIEEYTDGHAMLALSNTRLEPISTSTCVLFSVTNPTPNSHFPFDSSRHHQASAHPSHRHHQNNSECKAWLRHSFACSASSEKCTIHGRTSLQTSISSQPLQKTLDQNICQPISPNILSSIRA